MNDKVQVTLVFYEPDQKGNFKIKEFPARLNAIAPLEVLLPALLESYKDDVKMGPAEQLDVLFNIPRSSSLAKVAVVDGAYIIIMPKFVSGSLVERQDRQAR